MERSNVSVNLASEYEADVAVIGGGPAGIAAAICAARCGQRVVLIERHPFLGGMATAGLVGPFMTCFDATGQKQIVKGIFEELVAELVQCGGAIHPKEVAGGSPYASYHIFGHHHVTPVDPEKLKMIAMKMCSEAGVQILFDAIVLDVEVDPGSQTIAFVTGARPEGWFTVSAKVFIDASGDGDVAAFSGVPFTTGRASDGRMQPATLFFRVRSVHDEAVDLWVRKHRDIHHPGNERMFQCLVEKAKSRGEYPIPQIEVGVYRELRDGEWRVNATRILGVNGAFSEGLTQAEIEGRKQVGVVFEFLKKHCPGFEDSEIIDAGFQVGIRETRHICAQYTLTYEDVKNGRKFFDAIGCFAYPIDLHPPTGGETLLQGISNDFYQIPYRALVPLRIQNLLLAGRCISATHEAAASLRVIPASFLTGQAAGVAAALACQESVAPRDLDVTILQRNLRRQNVYLGDL